MKTSSMITAAAVTAALISQPLPATEPGDEVLSVTGAGRIAVSLDGRGYFRENESGRLRLGMRWPGSQGTEFLGSGGLLLKFRTGRDDEEVLLGPGDFEVTLTGPGVAGAAEGCLGGIRYPAEGCDDDGDGVHDEDPLDGRDNDGDGEVDEDFAAVGDGMYVTCFSAPRYGITVTRRHHVWNYGHVRDFIGFSTTIDYVSRENEGPLRGFELLQYLDFDIGGKDDPGRGLDDRVILIQELPEEDGKAVPPVAAASDATGDGPLAAVVIFHAGSPSGPLSAGAAGRKVARSADMLWEETPGGALVLGAVPRSLDIDTAELVTGAAGAGMLLSEQARGDVVLTHRFGPPVDIEPGGRVELEWAIVFGRDYATLARNISRARETWAGTELEDGSWRRWVVPARTAVRVPVDAVLAPVWVQGDKRPSVAVDLPEMDGEEIEWLRVAGGVTNDYETAGGRLVIALSDERASGGPFAVEAQLTDGRILTAAIDEEEILRYNGDEELQPGRLPEDSIKLFPNPFVTELEIDVLVHEPSLYIKSGRSAPAQPGVGSVKIYDVRGRLVRTVLADEILHPGEHALGWDGSDEAGMRVAPGVYYCRLQIGERSLTKRVILLR